jgi:hypothetical protein
MKNNSNAPEPSDAELTPALDMPRRLLCYAGEQWNSQLFAVQTGSWFKTCVVSNKGAVDFWLWICDGQRDKPTLAPIYVPALSTQSYGRTESPRLMPNGIYVCATTDPVTKTLIAAADAWFELAYEIDV